MRIAYATLVSPDWLLDDAASPDDPRSWGGGEYTRHYYLSLGLQHKKPVEVDGNFGLAALYMPASHCVARLLRVAMQKRKHFICGQLLKERIWNLATEMGLADSLQKELPELPDALPPSNILTHMMGGKVLAAMPEGSDESDMATTNATLLLSSATLFEWSAALLHGTSSDRARFLARLDSARALIQQSFDKRPPSDRRAAVKHSRKKPPASPPHLRKA